MSRVLTTIALLPRNACVVVLRAYRAVISPLYGNVCRYHPSCSRYALEAIQQYGVVRGSAMGAWRIARCNPWSAGGIDDVPDRRRPYPISRFGFVLPPSGAAGATAAQSPAAQSPSAQAISAQAPRTPALSSGAQLPRLTNQPARKA